MKIDVYEHLDCWQTIKDSAMFTMGKNSGKYPSSEWKHSILMAEHSPIRDGYFILDCYDIPSFVIGHIVRHFNGIEKYVQSLRSDRTTYKNDEIPNRNTLQNVRLKINFQAFINITRKRLCKCASKETREFWRLILETIKKYEPELYSVCVRECIYRGHCPEMKCCGYCYSDEYKKELVKYQEDWRCKK